MNGLTTVELITIHAALVQRHGGAFGIRDLGALEAAVTRPLSGFYDTPIEQAAALGESLFVNHPFLDGNKRVAFVAMDLHLRLNGLRIDVDADEAEDFIFGGLSEGTLDSTSLRIWLEAVVRPLPEVPET